MTIALRQYFYRQKDRHPVPVLLSIYAQRKSELCATKQCQRAMRLFYHYLPCLVSHGDLNSGKATYVAEFFPAFRLLIGGDRYNWNNQFAVSFIDSVKHSGATHWRNFSQRCYLRQIAATNESTISDARHAVRQCQFGQAAATIESIIPNARHAVRYDTVFASNNQCVEFCINY